MLAQFIPWIYYEHPFLPSYLQKVLLFAFNKLYLLDYISQMWNYHLSQWNYACKKRSVLSPAV